MPNSLLNLKEPSSLLREGKADKRLLAPLRIHKKLTKNLKKYNLMIALGRVLNLFISAMCRLTRFLRKAQKANENYEIKH